MCNYDRTETSRDAYLCGMLRVLLSDSGFAKHGRRIAAGVTIYVPTDENATKLRDLFNQVRDGDQ